MWEVVFSSQGSEPASEDTNVDIFILNNFGVFGVFIFINEGNNQLPLNKRLS